MNGEELVKNLEQAVAVGDCPDGCLAVWFDDVFYCPEGRLIQPCLWCDSGARFELDGVRHCRSCGAMWWVSSKVTYIPPEGLGKMVEVPSGCLFVASGKSL